MKLIQGWNEEIFKNIARRSNNKQAVRDVSYGRMQAYHNPQNLIAIRTENCEGGAIGIVNKDSLRIVVVAVDESHKGQGIGKMLIGVLTQMAMEKGKHRIYTKSKNVGFYTALKFEIVQQMGDEYILEKRWKA